MAKLKSPIKLNNFFQIGNQIGFSHLWNYINIDQIEASIY